MVNDPKSNKLIEEMAKAGAHFGYSKTRRHPSTTSFILATKNRNDIIDLEKTLAELEQVKNFLSELAKTGKKVLLVGVKPEAKTAVKEAALELEMPYVTERWIGGILTNFGEIKKRINKYLDLKEKRGKGELEKYTKKERLLIDREIGRLEKNFGGVADLIKAPDALFVIDAKKEHIAATEARKSGVPVIALCNTDTNLKDVDYPLVANDASMSSIKYFVGELVKAYQNK